MKTIMKAVLLSLMVCAAAFLLTSLLLTSKTGQAAPDRQPVPAAALAAGGYTVRAYNGHLAVFYDGMQDSPAIETSITLDQLRAVDREKLEKGIEVKTYEEVLKLLEDFSS